MFESCLRNTVKAQDQCLALYFIYMPCPKSWNHCADKQNGCTEKSLSAQTGLMSLGKMIDGQRVSCITWRRNSNAHSL